MTASRKFTRMTTYPVGRLVSEQAIPSIVSMLISGIYNLADTFFIGQINTQSVAAMGIVYAYMVLIQSMAIFFGQGSGNYISRALGRRETVDAEEMAAVGLGSSLMTGILLSGASFLAMRPLLALLGSTDTIMPYACDYFQFILLGTPFIMGTFTLNNQMRHQGNAILSMVGIVSGAVLNITHPLRPFQTYTSPLSRHCGRRAAVACPPGAHEPFGHLPEPVGFALR